MTLTVLGSSSKGNGYVLQNDKDALVLECGIPAADCYRALRGWFCGKVDGVLITHEHGDHAKYAKEYSGVFKMYASAGTAEALKEKVVIPINTIAPLAWHKIGNFDVMPVPANHDNCNEPYAYLIRHQEIGTILFATDTSYFEYQMPRLDTYLIEANYDKRILEDNVANGRVHNVVKEHTLKGHMEIGNLVKMLHANDLSQTTQIVLLHLSEKNADKLSFCRTIEQETGIPTTVATKGREIELFRA